MRRASWTALGLLTGAMASRLLGPAPTNPRGDPQAALEAVATVPPDVHRILMRSCADCHSNDTVWPWYARWAPVSWLTVGHVNRGRLELNFSEWGHYGERRKVTRLHAICDLSRRGAMPPASYTLVHRDSVMTPEETTIVCAWTTALASAESADGTDAR